MGIRAAGRLAVLLALAAAYCGCAEFQTVVTDMTPVHPKAQKDAYDRAMNYYGEENYVEAKKFWQDAVNDGPQTALGKKSSEYLAKVNQILRTLNEIQSK